MLAAEARVWPGAGAAVVVHLGFLCITWSCVFVCGEGLLLPWWSCVRGAVHLGFLCIT